jgi:hypothetical protein
MPFLKDEQLTSFTLQRVNTCRNRTDTLCNHPIQAATTVLTSTFDHSGDFRNESPGCRRPCRAQSDRIGADWGDGLLRHQQTRTGRRHRSRSDGRSDGGRGRLQQQPAAQRGRLDRPDLVPADRLRLVILGLILGLPVVDHCADDVAECEPDRRAAPRDHRLAAQQQ